MDSFFFRDHGKAMDKRSELMARYLDNRVELITTNETGYEMNFEIYDMKNAAHRKEVKKGPLFLIVTSSGYIRFSKEAAKGLRIADGGGVAFGTDKQYPKDWYVFSYDEKTAFHPQVKKNGVCVILSNTLAVMLLKGIPQALGSAVKAWKVPLKESSDGQYALALVRATESKK